MVRKVRQIRPAPRQTLVERLDALRRVRRDLVTVANAEWFSLFRDEIRNSIAIEGVFANRNDLLNVLERHKKTDRQKTAAILGYFEAASTLYEYANNQRKEGEFELRISDIKQIHTLLMRYEKEIGVYTGDLGEFRRGDVEVAHATFRPIKAPYIRPSMELLVKWANRALFRAKDPADMIRAAAAAHVWFETIHPFRDGNGRSGRILLSYMLMGCGLVNIAIKGITKTDRDRYYRSLEEADSLFEGLHQRIERSRRVSLGEAAGGIARADFKLLGTIIQERLDDSVERLARGGFGDVGMKADAVVPLRDAAMNFGFSQDYLRNLINRGGLKAHKRGKLWYVRLRDLQNYTGR